MSESGMHVEADAEEAERLAAIFQRAGGPSERFVALETVHAIKAELDEVPPRRLFRRWRLVRIAKKLAEEHGLVG